MTPDEAAAALQGAAQQLLDGHADVAHVRAVLMGNLHDLCRDAPMDAPQSRLFDAIEAWEDAVPRTRDQLTEAVRTAAQDLLGA